MATAAYVRVSTVGQNEAGQRREISRWLEGNGVTDVQWFVDKSSGDNLERPAFAELQTAIFAGEVTCVVTWKLDRLSRTIQDGLAVLSDWCSRSIRVVSVTQQIDFNGTLGKMLAAVLLGIGEMEQQNRRERQRAGIEAAKLKGGVYRGRAPGTTKGSPERALELRGRGLKLSEVAQAMGTSERTVQRYLKAGTACQT